MRNSGSARKPPKLVHNIIFSMPPGTAPRAVFKAVQRLAFNEWALEHRYAMALHTDDDHPHVHVVLKAISEQGERLNIRKATLRFWRAQFAANLRELGVDANATERAVRGQDKSGKPVGVYRANLRGWSTHLPRQQIQGAIDLASENHAAATRARSGQERTRNRIRQGWERVARAVDAANDRELAERIRTFNRQIPEVLSDNELLLTDHAISRSRTHDKGPRSEF